MSMPSQYVIQLTGVRGVVGECDFRMDSAFFGGVADSAISDGDVLAHVDIARREDGATLSISLNGTVQVPCDRCLAPVTVGIAADEELRVVYGDHYEDDGERVTIDEREGKIDLAGILFEFVALQVPLQHVHPEGECDSGMAGILKGLMVTRAEEEEE
mgnify:FL=1